MTNYQKYHGSRSNKGSLKRRLRRLVKEMANTEMDDMDYNPEEEDPAELARYDALNNNKDEMLYRDNPIYREAYDEMTMSESKMKITKLRLKRIIKEEKQKVLKEMLDSGHPDFPAQPGHAQVWISDETPSGIVMVLFADGTVYMENDEVLLKFPKSEIPQIIKNLQSMMLA